MTAPLWLEHARSRPWRILGGSFLFGAWLAFLAVVFMAIL